MRMKKTILFLVPIITMLGVYGCKEAAEVNMEQIHRLQDTVAACTPGVTAIDVKVTEQKELKVIISDAALYDKPADQRNNAAYKAGEKAMLLFGEENPIKSGVFIISKEARQGAWDKDPADGIRIDMKLDSLKEHDEVLMALFLKLKR
jgi:hypothetical protein